jgi:hypothetical protein
LEASHSDLAEPRLIESAAPPVDAGGMLTAARQQADRVLCDPQYSRRAASEHLTREPEDHRSVARLAEPDLEHHVANNKSSVRTQNPDSFRQGTVLVLVG